MALMLTIDYEMHGPHDGMLFRPVVTRSILYLSVIWGLVSHIQGALWQGWRYDSSALGGLLGSSADSMSPRCATAGTLFQAHITIHLEIIKEAAP